MNDEQFACKPSAEVKSSLDYAEAQPRFTATTVMDNEQCLLDIAPPTAGATEVDKTEVDKTEVDKAATDRDRDGKTLAVDKALVARRFARARITYDREAHVQRQVGDRLLQLLLDALLGQGVPPSHLATHFRHIVELGCGPGTLSRRLCQMFRPDSLLLNDLCPEMEECLQDLLTPPCGTFLPGQALQTDDADKGGTTGPPCLPTARTQSIRDGVVKDAVEDGTTSPPYPSTTRTQSTQENGVDDEEGEAYDIGDGMDDGVEGRRRTPCRRPNVHFVAGDAETLALPADTDLVVSCSTLQWFASPEAFFQHCHRALAPGAVLALSTFGPDNLRETRLLTGQGLAYRSLDELRDLLTPQFTLLCSQEEHIVLRFPSPTDVLHHLKLTGATGTDSRLWTPGRLRTFCRDYISHFSLNAEQGQPIDPAWCQGVSLTYHPIYLIAMNLPSHRNEPTVPSQ